MRDKTLRLLFLVRSNCLLSLVHIYSHKHAAELADICSVERLIGVGYDCRVFIDDKAVSLAVDVGGLDYFLNVCGVHVKRNDIIGI